MEFIETDIPVDKIEVEASDSADDFQKFIYELFDKNGILNDLRAYLRGHIVNVLKSVQTGDPLLCQKHFTQRLELASQALNILIAEYLLRLEFTYSLSVFVSEIPLSNMVFDFAKALMKGAETSNIRFKENDVWSVLNYLGVQCDSEHALKIVDMYKTENNIPLLHCILKCMPMYRQESGDIQEEQTSQDSLTSSTNSIEEKKTKIHTNISCHEKCRHYTFCKTCQHRILKIKEKYKKKKEQFVKMFEQLRSVYEAEVDMVRQEEECRVKRTLASHALQLQQRRQELEESLKTREAELESTAQQKKQFLWGVARALRSQHEHVSRAMALVKQEQELLAEKESNLKAKTLEAEESIRKKGEEMRIQISSELAVLAEQLESIKRERDSLNQARDEFENLKTLCDSKTKIIEAHGEKEKQDLKKHYEKLKDEFTVLKKIVESAKTEPKYYVDQGTITDLENFPSNCVLNNTQCTERNLKTDINSGGVRTPNKVLNDLKKPKNVNFSQSNLDQVYGELSRERSRSSISSDEGDRRTNNDTEVIQRLMEENENLKHYAKQQREHISALWSERVRNSLPGVSRPCTAPAVLPAAHYFTVHGVNPSTSANTFGWRKGAGEELSLFPEQRILLPGEPLPLFGLVRDRHSDNRRHLINQWRALKRTSPLAGVSKPRPPMMGIGHLDVGHQDPALAAGSNIERMSAEPVRESNLNENLVNTRHEAQEEHPDVSPLTKAKSREKSPKTVLKEAKEKLRNKSNIKEKPPLSKREKSPNSMLREAKLRLRKLEIEAEAVEQSYKDFRKRQAELRDERESLSKQDVFINSNIVQGIGINQIKIDDTQPLVTNVTEIGNLMKNDFDKYLRDYQTKYDIGETHFKNKTFVQKIKPIPSAYSEVNAKREENKRNNVDYLATPLMEFRKFYHAEKERTGELRSNREQLKVGSKSDYCSIKINEDETALLKNENDAINATKNNNKDGTTVHEANVQKIVDSSETLRILKFIRDDVTDIQNENIINNTNSSEQEENNTVDVIEVQEHIDSIRLETLRKIRNNKAAELEILKENITKMYNLQSSPRSHITTVDENAENLGRDANTLEQNIDSGKQIENADTNLLMVEVESSCEMNKVKLSESQEDELLIVVQSSANTKEGSEEALEKPTMSVTLSPKDRQLSPKDFDLERNKSLSIKSKSPEKAATNDVLNAIYQADDNHDKSSIDMNLELGNIKDDNISDVEKDAYDDYPDDFSADVDNYNSRSDYGNNSPISLPKTSEDENFWDN